MCKQVLVILLLAEIITAQDMSYIDLLRPYKEMKVSGNRIGSGRSYIMSKSSLCATQQQFQDLKVLVEKQMEMLADLAVGQKKLTREKSRHGKWYKHIRKYLKKIYKSCTCGTRGLSTLDLKNDTNEVISDMIYSKATNERMDLDNGSEMMVSDGERENIVLDSPPVSEEPDPGVGRPRSDIKISHFDSEILSDSKGGDLSSVEHVTTTEATRTSVSPYSFSAASVFPMRHHNDENSGNNEDVSNVVANLETGMISGNHSDITWLDYPSRERQSRCGRQGLVRLNFRDPSTNQSHDKIKIDMWFDTPRDWVFNVGDSKSNDGGSGDGTTQENDSEAQGYGTTFSIHASDKSRNPYKKLLYEDKQFIKSRVTLIVSDEAIVWNNHGGNFNFLRSPALFALNSQSDTQGDVNFDVYLSLNRVVAGTYRSGRGLCKIALRWLD